MMRDFAAAFWSARSLEEIAAGDRLGVEAEVDGRIVTFRAVVRRAHPDVLWIALATPDPRMASLEAGQPVHLTFSRDGGAIVAASAFLHPASPESEQVFVVARPLGPQAVQRREHLRLDVERTLRVLAINDNAPADSPPATTVDISTGGALVETRMAVAVGDKVKLELELAVEEIVACHGLVVRIDEPPFTADRSPAPDPDVPAVCEFPLADDGTSASCGPESPFRVAIRFLDPMLADQDRILRHIFEVQRSRREAGRKAS